MTDTYVTNEVNTHHELSRDDDTGQSVLARGVCAVERGRCINRRAGYCVGRNVGLEN